MTQINWRYAVENILPWIKEEIEKNGRKENFKYYSRRCITVSLTVLMDKLGMTLGDKKIWILQPSTMDLKEI